jgi:hypothetical protein
MKKINEQGKSAGGRGEILIDRLKSAGGPATCGDKNIFNFQLT